MKENFYDISLEFTNIAAPLNFGTVITFLLWRKNVPIKKEIKFRLL